MIDCLTVDNNGLKHGDLGIDDKIYKIDVIEPEMSETINDLSPPSCTDKFCLSSEETLRLIRKMARLGFLEILPSEEKRPFHYSGQICKLLIISQEEDEPFIMTMDQLILLLESQLKDLGGRVALSNVSSQYSPQTTNVLSRMIGNATYQPFVIRAAEKICENENREMEEIFPRRQMIGPPKNCDLITCEYLDNIIYELFEQFDCDENIERIMITDLAKNTFKLPADFLYLSIQKYLQSSLRGKLGYVLNHGGKDGARQLCGPHYVNRRKEEIYNALRYLKEPKTLDLRYLKRFEWDVPSILDYIRSICLVADSLSTDRKNMTFLDADISMNFDSNYLSGEAIFVPRAYMQMQREKVLESYSLHGYISFNQCTALGISKSRVKDFLIELLVREF